MEHSHRQMGKMGHPDMEPFSLKTLNESCHQMVCPTPLIRSVINSFIFLTEGEVVVESCENNFIVKKDELLFIPNGVPFSIKYYKECIGYMGGFHNSFLSSEIIQPHILKSITILQSQQPIKECFDKEESLRINLTLKITKRKTICLLKCSCWICYSVATILILIYPKMTSEIQVVNF